MPRRQMPTGFTAGKVFKLEGTTYTPGDPIPGPVVNRVKRLSALLSNGMIKVANDVYGRTRLSKRDRPPTWYSPSERKSFPQS